jgi:hypothetical protein
VEANNEFVRLGVHTLKLLVVDDLFPLPKNVLRLHELCRITIVHPEVEIEYESTGFPNSSAVVVEAFYVLYLVPWK